MDDREIFFVHADDWTMLYIDGRLVKQGHSLSPEDVLEALGIQHKVMGIRPSAYQDDQWDAIADRRVPFSSAREFLNRHKEYGDDI